MKIEDLVQLLDNRLREFKLSRDYAKMNGDLERMNFADKEVLSLEDTLFKLNLLVDTSKSTAAKKAILAEVMTNGSVSILDAYDISRYATDPLHEKKVMDILSKMGVMDTVEKIDDYIKSKRLSSPITGEMVMSAAEAYAVDARLIMAIMEQDSSFGTAGKAVRTRNPGNVGNDDSGNLRFYDSWQEGVTAVAEWLNRHRASKMATEILEETIPIAPAASISEETFPISPIASGSEEIIPVTTSTTTTTTTTTAPVASASTPFSIPSPTPVVTSTTTTTPTASTSEETLAPVASSSATTSTPSPTPEPTPQPSDEPTAGTAEPTPEPTPETTTTTTTTTESVASTSEETITSEEKLLKLTTWKILKKT